MRLLNTKTYSITEFFEANIPRYAILSHTWGQGEVTYQDIAQSVGQAREKKPQGFAKVEGACALAYAEGFDYIWIDTCCIDKTSSAELSEAINSMYAWYRESSICYAYLIDVRHIEHPTLETGNRNFDEVEFGASRWFTRGWTLQELIAPSDVAFYSGDWHYLGRKSFHKDVISRITGIDVSILAGADPSLIAVARKMYWASRRTTTRIEDMAYCLMGLFSVSMPLIYGEGEKAFLRLQEEIIKTVDDQSIFAWQLRKPSSPGPDFYGLLADSPSAFEDTGGNVSPFASSHSSTQATRIINNTLQTTLMIQNKVIQGVHYAGFGKLPSGPLSNYRRAVLGCRYGFSGDSSPCIELWCLDEEQSQFARIRPWNLFREQAPSISPPLRVNSLSKIPSLLYEVPLYFGTMSMDLLLNRAPWEYKQITVSHNPREFIPFGFRLQYLSYKIGTREGYPADRWHGNDRVLQRAYHHRNGPQQNTSSTSQPNVVYYNDPERHVHVARITEGAVRVIFKEKSFKGWCLLHALVLGMDIIHDERGGDWERKPWCRIVELEPWMQVDEYKYEFDWNEGESSKIKCSSHDALLLAKVIMLPGDELYTVQLNAANMNELAYWWPW
ncbi:HET domain-containing protein [Trichoderma simmonsii]|uniref:HET domain-containing protein n=1 Tax=Trichoderma simmonsii TaxID=1491479 RepID=A0A8G0L4H9_9HYPO|nr:HET domain-containing protein [Trichoderma simmonsii]